MKDTEGETEWVALSKDPDFRAAIAHLHRGKRGALGWTQDALAAEAGVGLKQVQRIEQQKCDQVSWNGFASCARALGLEAADLRDEARRSAEDGADALTAEGGALLRASPSLPDCLVGRDAERDQCLNDLNAHIGIVLYGAPGQGKTTLARYIGAAAADHFGVVEVDLESERQIENLPRRIAVALGQPDLPSSYEPLRGRAILLILDGFDLLRDSTSKDTLRQTLDSLIASLTPNGRLIITCQANIEKHQLVTREVTPLMAEDGVALFHEHSEGFYRNDPETSLLDFVSELDAHPLSIKIVARYGWDAGLALPTLRQMWRSTWEDIAASPEPSLDDRSLRASFELSFEALPASAKSLFLALGLLPDGLSEQVVENVWPEERAEIYGAVRLLRQRSFLDDPGAPDRRPPRLRGPLFLFANAKARQRSTLKGTIGKHFEEARRRIDSYFDRYVAENAPQFRDVDSRNKNRLIRQEFHNIHASLDRRLEISTRAETVAAARSILLLYWAYHNNLSGAHNPISSPGDAVNYLKKAEEIFLANGRSEDARSCRYYVGNIHWLRGEIDLAKAYLPAVSQDDTTDDELTCETLRTYAHIEYKQGSIAESVTLYERVMDRARGRYPNTVFRCWVGLFDAYRKLAFFEEGRKLFAGIRQILDALSGELAGNLYRGYAYLLLAEGSVAGAREEYENAIAAFRDNEFGLAHCWRGLGDIDVREGNFDAAYAAFEKSMKFYEAARKVPSLGIVLVTLGRGRLELAKGNLEGAEEFFRSAVLTLGPDGLDEPYELAVAHELLGDTLLVAEQRDKAKAEYRLALNLFDRTGASRVVDRLAEKLAGLDFR
ncbi:MAG: helix-turn-helix domain-containing protein [Alphaproteobacteria bacterium]|nr:helix-turn-helix domain-containing protein [Alphaproteobacteria bacterium]MBV9371098.1 helix-turn-helix domain-containing protein [Alphaproteobacteria bacterium]MBV9901528.1 helix-turn-helix domain-containing protein [Alphaproteobacteria bacterium]